ncbi:MAG: alcohol dehydrogenase, partial [Parvibaculum sp.]|nr:alcohol dehydrogenase [Parvibaculum sp.]
TAAARYLGLKDQSFNGFVNWVLALREEVGIPHTLKEIGVDTDVIPEAAPMALEDPCTGGNPLPMTRGEYETLYAKAIEGKLA